MQLILAHLAWYSPLCWELSSRATFFSSAVLPDPIRLTSGCTASEYIVETPTQAHILVVDDERIVLDLFETLFISDPLRLTCVEDGKAALHVLRTEGADVVIVDKNLRDISGLEVLKVAKEILPSCEVIMITGAASLDSVLLAMELDAFDYILKPIRNIFDIKAKVRKALDKQRIVRENQRLLKHLQEHAQSLERALEERKRMEAELIQSEKLAGIGTLAAGIAHEISSPLFGILGMAEAIADEDDLKLCHEYAREIIDYSKQIREIVQDLSAYSRTARNEGLVKVDLKRSCEDAVRLVFRSRKTEPVDTSFELADDLIIDARPNEIQQVLVNLLNNAVDAFTGLPAQAPRRIVIRGKRQLEQVVLTVQDSGTGISPASLEKVFEPFYTTKGVGKGTGLGLHIVWRIVTRYEGSIQVESTPGQGTCFTLRFPAREQ